MKITTVLMLAAALSAAPLFGQSAEDEIVRAEKDWAAALLNDDFDLLGKRLDASMIYAHSSGMSEDRETYLARVSSGRQSYSTVEHEKTTVFVHGDAAVAYSRVRLAGKNPNGAFDNRLMMMHTWVKKGGQWRLAAHHATRLPKE